MCARECVCVSCESVCVFVLECVRVVSPASRIFFVCACTCGSGRREGTSWQTCQVFVEALYVRNFFYVYIMTIN